MKEKRKHRIIHIVYLVLGLTVLAMCGLCGCAQSESREQTSDQDNTTATAEKTTEEATDTTDYGEKSEPLALLQISEEPEVLNDVLTFGQLQITLPENTDIEIVTLADGSEAVSLWGSNKNSKLPLETYLRHLRADWQEPLAVNQLVWALMELTGAEQITCRHMDLTKEEMSFFFTADYKNYFAFVRGEDIYLAEEVCREYSFTWRMYDDMVYWADTGEQPVLYGDVNRQYVRIAEPDGNVFFLIGDDESSTVYKEGYFEMPVGILECGMAENAGDVNFDGYPDLGSWSMGYYLYQPKKEQFEKAYFSVEPEGYSEQQQFFEEEQTIWSFSKEYQSESPYGLVAEHEYIWQWEGNTLALIRECTTTYGDGTIQVCAKEGKEVLFDTAGQSTAGKMDTVWAQPLFAEFYEGLVPKEVYYIGHEAPGEVAYVPQSLIDALTDAMLAGEIQPTLEVMMNDRVLSAEEIAEYAEANTGLLAELGSTELMGSYVLVMADIDNDGITDILSEEYFGGTAGFTEFVCFKGMEDGSFVRTSRYSHVMEEFGIICYEGKNYLCRTAFDYNKKQYNGLDLFCYEDGVRKEEVRLRLSPDGYMVTMTECLNDYLGYVEKTLSAENCVIVYENIEEFMPIVGNAESEAAGMYQSDINNDGISEKYQKSIWQPSNMGTYSNLQIVCADLPLVEEIINNGDQSGIPMMMWVDEVADKNIMNVLYRTGLYDFYIVGFLVENTGYEQLYRIDGIANCTVSQERLFIYEVPNAGV